MEEVGMIKHRGFFFFTALLLVFSASAYANGQSDLSVKEIVARNIEAAGGTKNLSNIKNYSFRSGPTTYYMSKKGMMKQTEGRNDIITEVILVEKNKVRKNCFNKVTEISGIQRSTYQCLAQLQSGVFTLQNFGKQLESKGLKKFGPQNLYWVTAQVGDLTVDFYLDSKYFTLKRLVFKGFDEDQNLYEINHDFGPYEEFNGVRIPSTWFRSQVGTRGRTVEIADVKINPPLAKNFFSDLTINAGEVEIGKGSLKGNVIQSSFRRNMLTIATNWTDECIQGAGFKAKDKLVLQLGGTEIEIELLESFPPRSSLSPGAKFIVPNPRSENYVIYLISPEFKDLAEQLEPLLLIRLIKSQSE